MSDQAPLILIADDNNTMRLMIRKSLEEAGFSVVEALNGVMALELFVQKTPVAVLLDVEMPEMDGITACAELRKLPEARYIPIMMVTSRDDPDSIKKAYLAGATEFTTKPVNWEILGHRLKYMIRNSDDFINLQKSQNELETAKEEIAKNNIELEKHVAERTKQLNAATVELQNTLNSLRTAQKQLIESEKTTILNNLVEGISHETLTPINTTIQSLLNLKNKHELITDAINQNNLKRSELLNFNELINATIHNSHENLKRAIELIKNLRQLMIDKTTASRQKIVLDEYLQETLIGLQPALKQTKLSVEIDCPGDLVINSYPSILFHVIMTLVSNSILHGFEPDEAGKIKISVIAKDNDIILRYSDTGRGIDKDNLDNIFEPFYTTETQSGKAGLGLYLIHAQVTKILGGNIECVKSEENGAAFILTIPKT